MKHVPVFLLVLCVVFPIGLSSAAWGNNDGCLSNWRTDDYDCRPKLIGVPKIVDGDTIRIGSTRIRLHGIDAPEAKQTCTANGKDWRCGWEATMALANVVAWHWVICHQRDIDRYGLVVAVCRAGPIDLSAWMVGKGWAVAYRLNSPDYVADEDSAKSDRRGIWRGQFVRPREWRQKMR
ncbi:MAG: thermonuclease family protein [Rhodospirillales bacterium]|mgnify:CR=1 FL=1|jgi:endonuclease YncB( thermonuclease family)|nr:thermonuclease family protein [Rhodospirillales bacterium]MDP6645886.1 thermonuclease family protein [Rhodospirillales bacterium]|tara:strand:- start:317 stop:853 length:537 start_codon:yes stop_codon:yes gene_type:complete